MSNSNYKTIFLCIICFVSGMLVNHAFFKNVHHSARKLPRTMYTTWEDGKNVGQNFDDAETAMSIKIERNQEKIIREMSATEKKAFISMEKKIVDFLKKNPGKRIAYGRLLEKNEMEILEKIKDERIEFRKSLSFEEKKIYKKMLEKMNKENKLKLFAGVM